METLERLRIGQVWSLDGQEMAVASAVRSWHSSPLVLLVTRPEIDDEGGLWTSPSRLRSQGRLISAAHPRVPSMTWIDDPTVREADFMVARLAALVLRQEEPLDADLRHELAERLVEGPGVDWWDVVALHRKLAHAGLAVPGV
jgi:hypothetical protein